MPRLTARAVDGVPTHAWGERAGRLEIILPDGLRLKVEGSFDGGELARLVKGLIA